MLKSTLVECAWAASKVKNTYLKSKYRKVVLRLGKKKALLVIAHKILDSIYWILREEEPYKELGEDYLKNQNLKNTLKYYQKQIENLGYNTVIVKNAKANM